MPSIYHSPEPTPLFTAKQIYAIEQAWFEAGNDSYALMQQASWSVASWIYQYLPSLVKPPHNAHHHQPSITIDIWTGSGNNGGDGWCVARYLHELAQNLPDLADKPLFSVQVIEVAEPSTPDSQRAKAEALDAGVPSQTFANWQSTNAEHGYRPNVIVDALFGIGLSRVPTGDYAEAIHAINQAGQMGAKVIALDVPSGLNASTGQVYPNHDNQTVAITANVTLCLLARKVGLHLKAGKDHAGDIIDLPLIPLATYKKPTYEKPTANKPTAWRLSEPYPLPKRQQDSHKGSFGHVLIVGGNRLANGQGMGGASILSAKACFAVGAGKVTVACHEAFHASLLARVPHAMCLDLQTSFDKKLDTFKELASGCNVMVIGMGLGRDAECEAIFRSYLQMAMDANLDMIIDADGLYHLATLEQHNDELYQMLKTYMQSHSVYFTPHSGEAGRLLGISAEQVENDRLSAITQLAEQFGGAWLLKGAGSIVIEEGNCYVCDVGNVGMATAGMGDVLSGMASGLLAQSALPKLCRTLHQTVLMHGQAGDALADMVGEYRLDASMMAKSH